MIRRLLTGRRPTRARTQRARSLPPAAPRLARTGPARTTRTHAAAGTTPGRTGSGEPVTAARLAASDPLTGPIRFATDPPGASLPEAVVYFDVAGDGWHVADLTTPVGDAARRATWRPTVPVSDHPARRPGAEDCDSCDWYEIHSHASDVPVRAFLTLPCEDHAVAAARAPEAAMRAWPDPTLTHVVPVLHVAVFGLAPRIDGTIPVTCHAPRPPYDETVVVPEDATCPDCRTSLACLHPEGARP